MTVVSKTDNFLAVLFAIGSTEINHPVVPDDFLHDPRLLFAEDNQIV